MPTKKDSLNLGVEGKGAKTATKGKGSMNKIIIIAVVVLLLGGGAGAFFLMGGDDSAEVVSGDDTAQVVEVEEQESDPIYLPLDPAFVINFEHNGGIRYLQLSLQVMSYDQGVIDKVDHNMPAVRNNLILLFSGQDFNYLNTLEGKENLRLEVIKSIHSIVRPKGSAKVNDAFFTGFVMQ